MKNYHQDRPLLSVPYLALFSPLYLHAEQAGLGHYSIFTPTFCCHPQPWPVKTIRFSSAPYRRRTDPFIAHIQIEADGRDVTGLRSGTGAAPRGAWWNHRVMLQITNRGSVAMEGVGGGSHSHFVGSTLSNGIQRENGMCQ